MVFPPESPLLPRRTISVPASSQLQPSKETAKIVPANAAPSPVSGPAPLLSLPPQPSHVSSTPAPSPVSSSSFSLAPQPLFQWEASDNDYHEVSVVGTPPNEDPKHAVLPRPGLLVARQLSLLAVRLKMKLSSQKCRQASVFLVVFSTPTTACNLIAQ